MKEFTQAQLSQYDGRDGNPIYIAHKGNVYDVSESKLWRGGRHMKRHNAGGDLTTDIQAAPHDPAVLERFPQVGTLRKEQAQIPSMPGWISWLLEANPFFRRHPHPMTVHFPLVFMLSNPFFLLLFRLTGDPAFETTAFHCLGGGIVFMVVAIFTGVLTWWYNYMARMMKPIAIKVPLSISVLIIAIALFVWRWNAPDVMTGSQGPNIVYLLLSLSFIPQVGIIGWYGASMTFPLEDEG
ncbi:MAG: cytochrome b5 domain-containing protein [Desulfobacteraceae bacterium]|jgi:predicted heme/steroid binding protein/uncharacterized membrane protein